MNMPSSESEPDRYKDRPILIVLENYVLAAIGALSDEKMQGMTNIVKRVFGGDEDWMATVRSRLGISAEIDNNLQDLWKKNQIIANENKTYLYPIQFAKMIVDENFKPIIDKLSNK